MRGVPEKAEETVARILKGDVRLAARLMKDIEDGMPGCAQMLRELYLHTGRAYIVGVTGSPGVGKSTIVNSLTGEQSQTTLPVREADSRGRHATTSRMLFPLPEGGAIIDNPGMRELQLWASEDSLGGVFDDVAALASQCRFRDCTHKNEPECAVQSALRRGEIDPSRWRSYCKLQAELRHEMLQGDAVARTGVRAKWKAIHKAMRNHPKYRR